MTIDQKRLALMRTICDADSEGIDIIWNKLFNKKNGVKKADIEKAFADIANKEFRHDFFATAFLASLCVEITDKLFKEEK